MNTYPEAIFELIGNLLAMIGAVVTGDNLSRRIRNNKKTRWFIIKFRSPGFKCTAKLFLTN